MKIRMIAKLFPDRREKPLQAQNRVYAPVMMPYRLFGNLMLLAVIASICMIIVTIRDNLINKQISSLMNGFYSYSTDYGWGIDDIIIEGRSKTGRQELADAIGLSRADSILSVNLAQLKSQIEELPWVKKAVVKRHFFPNLLQIKLYEKDVLALWQSGDRFFPVATDGRLIEADYKPRQPLLIIVGRKAPEKINELLEATASDPQLQKRIKAAILFSGRRWDLVLDDLEHGITIKLPEKNIAQAWKKFIKINDTHGLLKRKLTIIDLRYKNKLSVTVGDSGFSGNAVH